MARIRSCRPESRSSLSGRRAFAVLLLAVAGGAACAGGGPPDASDAPLQIRFTLDESAFVAPPPPADIVPFDLVAADLELDGDPDLLVNWHHLAHLELFENRDGELVLINQGDDDRTGLYENPGIADLYASTQELFVRARAAGPGVYLWHDPDRRGGWQFVVTPADAPVSLTLRANRALTPRLDERFVRRRDEFEAELVIDEPQRFRVLVELVATQLTVEASLPIFAGAALTPMGERADLWKDDPHGIAWVGALGTPAPDLFISRGGLGGNLLPPHDPKRDRFFEYTGGDPLYADRRDAMPANYGRGRRVEWIDIEGDGVNELYVGNTGSPNALLAAGEDGNYRDIAPDLGLDFEGGDVFAWLDIDDDGRDDLVFLDAEGFRVARNRGEAGFEPGPGAAIGLVLPAGPGAASDTGGGELFDSQSLHVLDFDNDGRLDLWLAGHGPQRGHAVYRAAGEPGAGAVFEEVGATLGLAAAPLANATVFLDLENDGYLDALTFGAGASWLHNRGGARFEAEPVDPAWGLREFTRAVALDVDGDGRTDLAMADHRRLLARNETAGGSFLRVVLPGAGNHPVATVVTAFYSDGTARAQRYGSAGNTRYSQGSLPLHFGIPPGASIERLEIRWPDGDRATRAVGAGESVIELRR